MASVEIIPASETVSPEKGKRRYVLLINEDFSGKIEIQCNQGGLREVYATEKLMPKRG